MTKVVQSWQQDNWEQRWSYKPEFKYPSLNYTWFLSYKIGNVLPYKFGGKCNITKTPNICA